MLSPNRSIQLIASSPGSAEPDSETIRSDGGQYLLSVSSGSARMRWIITGTATSTCAWWSRIVRSMSSGSKRRRNTIVEAVGRPIAAKCNNPQE